MTRYLLIETRDPHESRDADWTIELAAELARDADVSVMLTENGVFAARAGCESALAGTLRKKGVRLIADADALRERGIAETDLHKDIEVAAIGIVADALMDGVAVTWR